MAHIHVCRHGQDMDNLEGLLNGHRDRPLTELGKTQAAAVAAKIKESGVSYAAIYASPLQRAFETACTIGEALSMSVVKKTDLIERDFGVLAGKPYADIPRYAGEKIFHGDNVTYFLEVEGGETFEQCYERASRVIDEMDRTHTGKHVLLVCHGDICMMLRAVRAGKDWKEGLVQSYVENTEVVEL